MTANYACPSCGGRLAVSDVANAWRCRRCREVVLEAISPRHQRVREFYERATSKRWGGLS